MKLNKFQFREISKYWFDLSKLSFVSLVLKLFEPNMSNMDLRSFLTIITGLILTGSFASIGILFSKGVKENE